MAALEPTCMYIVYIIAMCVLDLEVIFIYVIRPLNILFIRKQRNAQSMFPKCAWNILMPYQHSPRNRGKG